LDEHELAAGRQQVPAAPHTPAQQFPFVKHPCPSTSQHAPPWQAPQHCALRVHDVPAPLQLQKIPSSQ
jgi:hypothetical protein